MACEAKIRLASIKIPAHLKFIFGRISTDWATEVPKILTLLPKLIKLRRQQ
jgi:hypothetical protein